MVPIAGAKQASLVSGEDQSQRSLSPLSAT
jgi:hypothetical protein